MKKPSVDEWTYRQAYDPTALIPGFAQNFGLRTIWPETEDLIEGPPNMLGGPQMEEAAAWFRSQIQKGTTESWAGTDRMPPFS